MIKLYQESQSSELKVRSLLKKTMNDNSRFDISILVILLEPQNLSNFLHDSHMKTFVDEVNDRKLNRSRCSRVV